MLNGMNRTQIFSLIFPHFSPCFFATFITLTNDNIPLPELPTNISTPQCSHKCTCVAITLRMYSNEYQRHIPYLTYSITTLNLN